MKTATVSALRARLAEYLELTEPVLVTQQGRPKAVLWPVENEGDIERLLLANNAEFMKLLDEADQRISQTGGISHDQFWAQVNQESEAAPNRSRKRPGKRRR
jgi:prevent-host-death family protein